MFDDIPLEEYFCYHPPTTDARVAKPMGLTGFEETFRDCTIDAAMVKNARNNP